MPFSNPLGWYAFLALIPLILIYLRKPKPNELTIPSLMFFMKDRGITRFRSIMRYLFRNLLFLIQLAAISILAFSLTGFFLDIPTVLSGNTAIVIDASASMGTMENGNTRLSQAIAMADGYVGGKVTLILAADVPRVILENGGAGEARQLLTSISPLDTGSDIGSAVLAAKDAIKGKGKIYVFSDFIATEGIDPLVAKRAVSQGIDVQFFPIGGQAENIGITELSVGKSTTSVVVKNFNSDERDVKVSVSANGQVKDSIQLTLPPRSSEHVRFQTLEGKAIVSLEADDDFSADNKVYAHVPEGSIADVLLITNKKNSNLEAALAAAPNVRMEVAMAPVVTIAGHDVIVIHAVDKELLLPGIIRDVEKAADEGVAVIVTGQEDLSELHLPFLPVTLGGLGNVSQNDAHIINYLTQGIDFGVNERILLAVPKEGATTIVSANENAAIVIPPTGSGKAIYYGILDEYSSFKSSIGYPQFWSRIISFITQTEDLSSYNVRTGRIEPIPEQDVATPSGAIRTNRILFDYSGFYAYSEKIVAANLLNSRESDVSTNITAFEEENRMIEQDSTPRTERRRFDDLLALAAVVLILLELLYIKQRGDF